MKSALGTHDAVRETTPGGAALHDIMHRIESEYREMPGMCVTSAQAQRLWGLDSTTCSFVLATLVERHILQRTRRGTYVKY